jgi:hypothetical protein
MVLSGMDSNPDSNFYTLGLLPRCIAESERIGWSLGTSHFPERHRFSQDTTGPMNSRKKKRRWENTQSLILER